jgi:hypothetical protein
MTPRLKALTVQAARNLLEGETNPYKIEYFKEVIEKNTK